jgi:exopolyphosphatase
MKIGVIGNQACDADSIVSAYVYAWFLNHADPSNQYCAFVHCDLSELSSRLDFLEICKISNFSNFDFFSLSDSAQSMSSWILMDHHLPNPPISSSQVIEIIDHHVPTTEKARLLIQSVPRTDIRVIASTCTIVAERILKSSFHIPDHIKWMLMMVICTDTGNLSEVLATATPTDIAVLNRLKADLNVSDLSGFFAQVRDSKFSPEFWNSVSVNRMLEYDFKDINGVGMSVIFRSLIGLDDSEILSFAKKQSYETFVVLSGALTSDKSVQRELMIYRSTGVGSIQARLESTFSLSLIAASSSVLKYLVLDGSFSRKKFAPKFLSILSDS